MGFDLFKSADNSKDDEIRLIHVVKKIHNLREGTFANINNDLDSARIGINFPPMIRMAYAYARRAAAAGLFLQGVFNREAYDHAAFMFKVLQQQTGHTEQFQEEAAEQANELLYSYDHRLNRNVIIFITTMAEGGYVDEKIGIELPYEFVLLTANRTIEETGFKAPPQLTKARQRDVNIRDDQVMTPFMFACGAGKLDAAKHLLREGADIYARDNLGWTAFMWAASQNREKVVKWLLEKDVDIEDRAKSGMTTLMIAAAHGHPEIVRMLLCRNAEIDAQCYEGWTPLMYAAQYGRIEVIHVLLRNGADIHIQNKLGANAINVAAGNGHVSAVDILLKNGADPLVEDCVGYDALGMARRKGHADVVAYLLNSDIY